MRRFLSRVLQVGAVVVSLGTAFLGTAQAGSLAKADQSPLAEIAFADRPFVLPMDRNFQLALSAAGTGLGRRCGAMEAYEWPIAMTEQTRARDLFAGIVNQLRGQGFTVNERPVGPDAPDVILLTADRADKNLIALWSGGNDMGLILTLCEAKTLLPTRLTTDQVPEGMSTFRAASKIRGSAPIVGVWNGTYTCAQGPVGGTLSVTSVKDDALEGVFRFYPLPKNPHGTSAGSFHVHGTYNPKTQRTLLDPEDWIARPKGYDATVMLGRFDPATRGFSAYFMGLEGCTSFEAAYTPESADTLAPERPAKVHKKKARTATSQKTPRAPHPAE